LRPLHKCLSVECNEFEINNDLQEKAMTDENRFVKRTYREHMKSTDLTYFQVKEEQTDLYIGVGDYSEKLYQTVKTAVCRLRSELEAYIRRQPEFLLSLVPVEPLIPAPMIVQDMCHAAKLANVGPMAAVAGAFSKWVGQELLAYTSEIIIENGGDIWMNSSQERIISIFCGDSPLSGKLAVRIRANGSCMGVCTSSGTIGHSLSFGCSDAAMIIASDASLADAAATVLGNAVKTAADIEMAFGQVKKITGISGALVVIGDHLGAWGEIELVSM
jgi:ApbE superfamily uncharacterized protein (UPF0280 family)